MNNPYYTEKRVSLRFRVYIPIIYNQQGIKKEIIAKSRDISSKGLCIETEENFSKGALINICLKMTDTGEEVYRLGKVIWSNFAYAFRDKIMHNTGIVIQGSEIKPISIVLRTIKSQNKY